MTAIAAAAGRATVSPTASCRCRNDHQQHRKQQKANSHCASEERKIGGGTSLAFRVAVVQYSCASGGGHTPVTARLIISISGFGTGNMLLRYRWFDGENDGCRRATTFARTPVPGISTSKATGPMLLESTAHQLGAPAQGRRAGMIPYPRTTAGNPSSRMTLGLRPSI